MNKVFGIKIQPGCSNADVENAMRTLEEWFCQHGRWLFTCQSDSIQKLLGLETLNNDADMKLISNYSGETIGLMNNVFKSRSKLVCWLQKQYKTTRIAILDDSLSMAWADLVKEDLLQNEELQILAIRIDPLFARAETSLEEFTNDRQQCYRKCTEHGERVIERLIDGSLKNVVEEEIVFFPEEGPMNEPPWWFVSPCVNKSIGECLAESLSYNLSELRAIGEQNSLCVCELLRSQHDWDTACAMKIFIYPETLKKFNGKEGLA